MTDRSQNADGDDFYKRFHAAVGDCSLRHDCTDSSRHAPIVHTCTDGHSWREQPDGGVSPSWGMALTSIKYSGWDPRTCPEPERHQADNDVSGLVRGVRCPDCEEIAVPSDIYPGIRCSPWTISSASASPATSVNRPHRNAASRR